MLTTYLAKQHWEECLKCCGARGLERGIKMNNEHYMLNTDLAKQLLSENSFLKICYENKLFFRTN